MMRLGAVAILALSFSGAVACGGGSSRSGADATVPSNLTLDGVYARMERALDGGAGKVLHVTVTTTDVQSSMPTPEGFGDLDLADYADQLWIDAENGIARVETKARVQPTPTGGVTRTIVRGDGTFRVEPDGRSSGVDSLTCRGSDSPFLAQLMRCGNYLEKSTTTVESGVYNGRPAIVLVSIGKLPSEDAVSSFERRFYVDSSYLPLAAEFSESYGGENSITVRGKQLYDVEFVDRASLAADFFEPAGIGYVERNPAAHLTAEVSGMRVYWLGPEFAGSASVPRLALLGGGTAHPVPPYFESVRVTYAPEGSSDRTAMAAITLREYPVESWQTPSPYADGRVFPDQQGKSEDVSIPGGRAALFLAQGSDDRYTAQAYFDTTVVLVTVERPSPLLGTRDAMIEILKALRPYP